MKTPFRESHGSYGFATWGQCPSYEEAIHFLRGLATTSDGERNLRRTLWELTFDPRLAELSHGEVLETLARHLSSGTLRVWETPKLTPSVSLARIVETIEPTQVEAPPLPPPTEAPPPPVVVVVTMQAEALREAAEVGIPFCEV